MSANHGAIKCELSDSIRSDPNYHFKPHRLCSVCSKITKTSKVLDLIGQDVLGEPLVEIWSHHQNVSELKESISRGCHLCSLLYVQSGATLSKYTKIVDGGLPDGQLNLYISTKSNVKLRHPRGHTRFHFEFGLGKPNQKDGKIRPHEPLLLSRELPESDTPYESFLTASTGSDAAFATMSEWMTQCLKTHKCCSNQGEFPIYLPRRLLEITGTVSDRKIKLIETGTREKSEVPYLTLSHCWGTHVPLRLQKENYLAFLENIDYDELPQLFKDAVQTTVRLGFKHLWIDAMCIIQDHEMDWDEALRMSEVFGNSMCTISALTAKNGAESCMHNRSPLGFIPCRVETASGKFLDLVSWRARDLLKLQRPDSQKQSPLHQRAWVMQERYLTARQIHFSQNQLWWQCCEATFSEFSQVAQEPQPFLRAELRSSIRPQHTIEDPIFVTDAFWKGKFDSRGKLIRGGSNQKMDWHSSYWNLVEFFYTAGKLTRDEDRGPGMSGIANMIETVTGHRLLCGMWVSHLMFDMLWRASLAASNRRIDNGQPSWSWLAVTSPVFQDPIRWNESVPPEKRFTAEILELPQTTHEPPSVPTPYFYLPSKPLSLLIRAPMMEFPEIPKGTKLDGYFDATWQDIPATEPFSKVVARFLLCGYSCWSPDYILPDEELSDAWVLQWTRHEDYSRNHSHHQIDHQLNVSGLIVKPLDSEQTRWRRIGRFRICYRGRKGKPIGPLKTIRLY